MGHVAGGMNQAGGGVAIDGPVAVKGGRKRAGIHGSRHAIASKLGETGVSASAIGALTEHGSVQAVLEKLYIDRRSLRTGWARLTDLVVLACFSFTALDSLREIAVVRSVFIKGSAQ